MQNSCHTGLELLDVFFQLLCGDPMCFNENGAPRASRERLQTQGSRARVKVEATGPVNPRRQPVEQGLPDPLRSRAQTLDMSDIQKAATPVSGYNTQPSRLGFSALFSFVHQHTVLSPES
jgi:hypothetical protein